MKITSEKNKILLGIAAVAAVAAIFGALIFWRLGGVFATLLAPKVFDCGCAAAAGLAPRQLALLTAGLLFGGGLLAGALYAALTIFKTRRFSRRIFSPSTKPPAAADLIGQQLNLQDKVIFFEAADYQAFTFGLLRPRIAVSTAAADCLSEREFSALLLHEAHHRAKRDPLKILILDTLKYAFFFIPLLGYLVNRYKIAAEIEADEKTGDAAALGGALLRFTEHSLGPAAVASFASALHLRIERLLKAGQKPKFALPKGLLLLTLLVLGGIGLAADQKSASASADLLCRLQETRCLEIMSADKKY